MISLGKVSLSPDIQLCDYLHSNNALQLHCNHSSEHCFYDALCEVSCRPCSIKVERLTEMKIIIVGVTKSNESGNDVDNG